VAGAVAVAPAVVVAAAEAGAAPRCRERADPT